MIPFRIQECAVCFVIAPWQKHLKHRIQAAGIVIYLFASIFKQITGTPELTRHLHPDRKSHVLRTDLQITGLTVIESAFGITALLLCKCLLPFVVCRFPKGDVPFQRQPVPCTGN